MNNLLLTTNLVDTYINGRTDAFRLQEVLEGRRTEYGSGKTYAILMQMLGEAWLGDRGNNYLYVGDHQSQCYHVMVDFGQILTHEGFMVTTNGSGPITWVEGKRRITDRLYVGNKNGLIQLYLFWSVSQLQEMLPGWQFARVFLDMSEPFLPDVQRAELTNLEEYK